MINGRVCIDLLKSHYNDIISLFMNCLYCEVKKRTAKKVPACSLNTEKTKPRKHFHVML